MEKQYPIRVMLLVVAFAVLSISERLQAQDPVKVDSKHHSVVAENDSIRILRIIYGPGEKSVMHDHPSGLYVLLTDQKVRMTLPDGKSIDISGKAGEAGFTSAGKHSPENTSDKAFEVILVELKPKMQKSN